MGGDFGARIAELERSVGDGLLTMKVEVDQVYAHYQHEGLDLRHPHGGRAEYLRAPLYERYRGYYRQLADTVLDSEGLVPAAIRIAEDLSNQVYTNAPFEFGDLRASGHPMVTDDGHTVYDRPPLVHRLTDEELRIKDELRRLGFA